MQLSLFVPSRASRKSHDAGDCPFCWLPCSASHFAPPSSLSLELRNPLLDAARLAAPRLGTIWRNPGCASPGDPELLDEQLLVPSPGGNRRRPGARRAPSVAAKCTTPRCRPLGARPRNHGKQPPL